MDKYAALQDQLLRAAEGQQTSLRMDFGEIDALVDGLPSSARTHRSWWANARLHTQALAWLDAGWEVDQINLQREQVQFRRWSVRATQPGPTPRRDAVDPAAMRKLDSVSVRVSLTWRHAGAATVDATGRLQLPALPAAPGIYRLTFSGGARQRSLVYIGETDNLARQAGSYRNPGPTRQTGLRLNQRIREHLAAGGSVTMAIAAEARLEATGAITPLDLRRKAARLLAENAALVALQTADEVDAENVE